MKRWEHILTAGVLTMGLCLQSIPVLAADETTQNTEITATVEQADNSPEYSVVIPAAVSMGSINASKGQTIGYEIKVHTGGKNLSVIVSAPEEGQLLKDNTTRGKKESLIFTNDFGTQTVSPDAGQEGDGAQDYTLKGNISITADEIANASAGSYSGTTVFTIRYQKSNDGSDDKDDDKKDDKTDDGKKDDDKKDDKTDDGKTDDDKTDLDIKNLADGVYSIYGDMVKTDRTTSSMSDNAINHTIKLTVKNGTYYLTVNLHGMTVGQKMGYLSQLKYFTTGYTCDKYGNPQGTLVDTTVESYQKNADGTLVADSYGTDYPEKITFELIPEALEDGFVPLQVLVPIMESISSGMGTQPVFLRLDRSTLKATTSDDPDFDKDDNKDDNKGDNDNSNGNNNGNNNNGNGNNNGSSLGNNTLGNNSLGNNTLGGNKLGSSSLGGTSGLGTGSSLKTASTVKTGDALQNVTMWAAILLLGLSALVAGGMKYNRKHQR